MATYAEIIATIDTAIAAWADQPVSLSVNGRTVTYRSLTELTATRAYYAQLLRSQSGAVGFQIHHLQAGGPLL